MSTSVPLHPPRSRRPSLFPTYKRTGIPQETCFSCTPSSATARGRNLKPAARPRMGEAGVPRMRRAPLRSNADGFCGVVPCMSFQLRDVSPASDRPGERPPCRRRVGGTVHHHARALTMMPINMRFYVGEAAAQRPPNAQAAGSKEAARHITRAAPAPPAAQQLCSCRYCFANTKRTSRSRSTYSFRSGRARNRLV